MKKQKAKPAPVVTVLPPAPVPAPAPKTVSDTVAAIGELVDQASTISRILAEELRSSVLDVKRHARLRNIELGWGETLHRVRAELQRHALRI